MPAKTTNEKLVEKLVEGGMHVEFAREIAANIYGSSFVEQLKATSAALDYVLSPDNRADVIHDTEELGFHDTPEQKELLECLQDAANIWSIMRNG